MDVFSLTTARTWYRNQFINKTMIIQRLRKQGKFHVATVGFSLFVWIAAFGVVFMTRQFQSSLVPSDSEIFSETSKSNLRSPLTETSQLRTSYLPIPVRKPGVQFDIVKPYDYIFEPRDESWDSAPIVIESHKLVFFTIPNVGCTILKQLLRRMMKQPDWPSQSLEKMLPHNPKSNGLKYLYNYTLREASVMMTSPEWTRAMMVRDPKTRFLREFLDKAVGSNQKHLQSKCCPDRFCIEDSQTILGFVDLCHVCKDDHWHSQHDRIDEKYWPYMDHILHYENAAEDTKKLLSAIGAWDQYGKSGWGRDGKQPVFEEVDETGDTERYATVQQIWKWYTPESEEQVEEFYRDDYKNPLFNFTRGKCLTCLHKND